MERVALKWAVGARRVSRVATSRTRVSGVLEMWLPTAEASKVLSPPYPLGVPSAAETEIEPAQQGSQPFHHGWAFCQGEHQHWD
jgi:hypothetical protein